MHPFHAFSARMQLTPVPFLQIAQGHLVADFRIVLFPGQKILVLPTLTFNHFSANAFFHLKKLPLTSFQVSTRQIKSNITTKLAMG